MQNIAQYLAKTDVGNYVYHTLANDFARIGLKLNDSFYCMTVFGCMSMALQRAYVGPTHSTLNTFNMMCANAAQGKSVYLRAMARFQAEHHLVTSMGTIASAAGMRKSLERSASLVWIQDEWAAWLGRVVKGEDAHATNALNFFLELWNGPAKLNAVEASSKDAQAAEVIEPRVSIYGAGVVSNVSAALQSPAIKETGFVSRLILWTPGMPFEAEGVLPLSDTWKRHPHANGTLSWTPEAERLFKNGYQHYYGLQAAKLHPDSPEFHVWTRAGEQCIRFASLVACAGKRSLITDDDIVMGNEVVLHSLKSVTEILQGPDYAPSSFPLATRKIQETLEVLDSREQYSVHQIPMEAPWTAKLSEMQIKRYLKTLASYSLINYDDATETWSPTSFFGQNVLEVMRNGLVE